MTRTKRMGHPPNLLNDGTYTYDWTAFGKAGTVNGISVTYDALGRAIEQNNAGTLTQIVYDNLQGRIATMNGQSLIAGFVGLPSGATAVYQSTGLAWYRHADMLGSSRLATKADRTLYSDRAYAPYGEVMQSTKMGAEDNSFTGKDEGTVSGIYDFPARAFIPAQGRWASPDPSGLNAIHAEYPQSTNRYAYVLNNPIIWTDPSGLDCWNPDNPNPCTDCRYAPCVYGGGNGGSGSGGTKGGPGGGGAGGGAGGQDLDMITDNGGSGGSGGSGGGNGSTPVPPNRPILQRDPGGKKKMCDDVSNMAFFETLLPGAHIAYSALTGVNVSTALEQLIIDTAKDKATEEYFEIGIPAAMADAFGIGERFTKGIIGKLWVAFAVRDVMKAMDSMAAAYQQCMK